MQTQFQVKSFFSNSNIEYITSVQNFKETKMAPYHDFVTVLVVSLSLVVSQLENTTKKETVLIMPSLHAAESVIGDERDCEGAQTCESHRLKALKDQSEDPAGSKW